MKTLFAPTSSWPRPMHSLWIASALLSLFLATGAGAAVTPLSVPASGIGPLTFDSLPTTNDGWSTASAPGFRDSISTVSAMEAAAKTNQALNIVGVIFQDREGSTPTFAFTTSATFRWNSVDHNLESRPVAVAYTILLLTLRNDAGHDTNVFRLEYDFGAAFPTGTLDHEDDNNLLAGFRVYYSLSGRAGSWTHIPDFDGGRAVAGHRSAIVNLPSPWVAGGNLYIMWTDDDAVAADGGSSPGLIEGPYTIDNLSVTFGGCDVPIIVTPPHDASVESCRGTNLSVVATGFGLHYQWLHEGTNLPGPDSPILNIPLAGAANAGSYFVRITNACSDTVATSPEARLTVTPDFDPPTVVSALALVDGLTYRVSFSELMDTNTLLPGFFIIRPAAGGTSRYVANVIIAANGRDVTLQSDAPRLPNVNYELIIQGPVVLDCSQNPLGGGFLGVPLEFEVALMTVENTPWKYNHSGNDLSLDWIAAGYDDSTWSNGISVLDSKSPIFFIGGPRNTVSGQAVMTQLSLTNDMYSSYTNVIPVYYFRGSFTLPAPLADLTALQLRTFVDDFVVVWLNGDSDPIYNELINGADPDPYHYGYSGGSDSGDANFLPTTGSYSLDLSKLVDGQNLVAAKVFQQTNTSSDITFALELIAVIKAFPETPKLTISLDAVSRAILLGWPAGTGSQLYEATQPDATGIGGPNGWNLVSGATDGFFSVTLPGAGAVQKFYSLRK